MPTVHLIDASPYLFRAWFSLPKSIVDPKGKPMNAVYGFATFLPKYIADEKPTHLAVAFDRHFNGSFRNECLNANWFDSLDDARRIIEAWRRDYNADRPHSSLGGLTPIEYQRLHQTQTRTQTLV